MEEIWKDVEGYEAYYQVSNLGSVKRKDRLVTTSHGVQKALLAKSLVPLPNSSGYLRVQFTVNGQKTRCFVHRLVAKHFIENTNGKPCVNHIDSDCTNNSANNLEWVTYRENTHHAINKGRFDAHFKKTGQIFSDLNKELRKPVVGTHIDSGRTVLFKSINDAGRAFGVANGDICNCCKGNRHKARGYRWHYATPDELMKYKEEWL